MIKANRLSIKTSVSTAVANTILVMVKEPRGLGWEALRVLNILKGNFPREEERWYLHGSTIYTFIKMFLGYWISVQWVPQGHSPFKATSFGKNLKWKLD